MTLKKGLNTEKNKRILFFVVIGLFMAAGIILAVCVARKKSKKNEGLKTSVGQQPPMPTFIGGGSGVPVAKWSDSVSMFLNEK